MTISTPPSLIKLLERSPVINSFLREDINGGSFLFFFDLIAFFFLNSNGVDAIRQKSGFEQRKQATSKTIAVAKSISKLIIVPEWKITLESPTVFPTISSVKE